MSRTYVIADLHGRLDLLERCLGRIEASPSGGTVIFLGDYVDRGHDSRGVLERVRAGPLRVGWEWVALKGNHEDMMVGVVLHGWDIQQFRQNGGGETMESFRHHGGWPPSDELVQWMRRLPLYHEDTHRLYTHAGVDVTTLHQTERTLLWGRMDGDVQHVGGRHVVHGHTIQHRRGPFLGEHRTNLDTGSFIYGVQHVGVFEDDLPGGPVEVWAVRE